MVEPMQKTYHIKTYGCQMNVYDSERMDELLAHEGYAAVASPNEADLVILNTCHIREKAAEKVYSDIGRLRKHRPIRTANGRDTLVAVAGCVAQAEGAEIMRRAPSVNLVFGPQTYHRLPQMLRDAATARQAGSTPQLIDTDYPPEAKFDHLERTRQARGPSAFLTIQEGCDKFCSFCVVPYTRGAEVSRPVAAIVEEARSLVEQGARELVLIGQNVNAYHGLSAAGTSCNLTGLAEALSGIDDLKRLRYTTSHPLDMSEELMQAHATNPKLMPYLHLPIQSGSDHILHAMNRRHTAANYRNIIARLRTFRPDIAISGDFIVGFPGETEADFQATLDLVSQIGYAAAYCFKYSPRPGTPAADDPDQIAEPVMAERLARLQALLNAQHLAFNRTAIGTQQSVLIERAAKQPGHWLGRTPHLQLVTIAAADINIGDLVEVVIVAAGPNSLEGEIMTKALAA